MRNPLVTPTPEQLIGFLTLEEAVEAQRVCLQESMAEVRRFMRGLRSDVAAGRVRLINPEHPQPVKEGVITAWTDDSDAHAALQKGYIKTESN
jgi:hypothetical protein